MSAERLREAARTERESLDGGVIEATFPELAARSAAIADLLDVCAKYYDLDDDSECDECLAANALADAILGGK